QVHNIPTLHYADCNHTVPLRLCHIPSDTFPSVKRLLCTLAARRLADSHLIFGKENKEPFYLVTISERCDTVGVCSRRVSSVGFNRSDRLDRSRTGEVADKFCLVNSLTRNE